jgi:hypothetical protein
MESILIVKAKDFLDAVRVASGKFYKHRITPVRVILDAKDPERLSIADAPRRLRTQEITFIGDFQGCVEVDGRTFIRIAGSLHTDVLTANLIIDADSVRIKFGSTAFTLPRLDKKAQS